MLSLRLKLWCVVFLMFVCKWKSTRFWNSSALNVGESASSRFVSVSLRFSVCLILIVNVV